MTTDNHYSGAEAFPSTSLFLPPRRTCSSRCSGIILKHFTDTFSSFFSGNLREQLLSSLTREYPFCSTTKEGGTQSMHKSISKSISAGAGALRKVILVIYFTGPTAKLGEMIDELLSTRAQCAFWSSASIWAIMWSQLALYHNLKGELTSWLRDLLAVGVGFERVQSCEG